MTQTEKDKIKLTLDNIFIQIKEGSLEGGWEVYDEFEKQLKELL